MAQDYHAGWRAQPGRSQSERIPHHVATFLRPGSDSRLIELASHPRRASARQHSAFEMSGARVSQARRPALSRSSSSNSSSGRRSRSSQEGEETPMLQGYPRSHSQRASQSQHSSHHELEDLLATERQAAYRTAQNPTVAFHNTIDWEQLLEVIREVRKEPRARLLNTVAVAGAIASLSGLAVVGANTGWNYEQAANARNSARYAGWSAKAAIANGIHNGSYNSNLDILDPQGNVTRARFSDAEDNFEF